MYSVAEVAQLARAMQLNRADTSALAVAEYDETDSADTPCGDMIAEEDSAEVEEYLSALEAEESDSDDSEADDSATEETEESRIVIYTTATMGDIPGTIVIDEHAGEFNGRTVRKVAVHEADWDAQRKAYFSQGRIARTEQEWQRLVELTVRGGVMPLEPVDTQGAVRTPAGVESPAAVESPAESEMAEWYEKDWRKGGEAPPAPDVPAGPGIPAEILEAERLAAVAREAQRAYQAAQDAAKAAQEAMKAAATAAAEAKAKAPVLITPEIRAQIDRLHELHAQGEQAYAKAIRDGLLFMRVGDKPRRDTGTVRKVAAGPNSSGSVDLHIHGTNGTAVNHGSSKVMSEERTRLVRQVKELLASHSDTQIARILGLEPVKGSKFVWNVRDKVSRGVVGYATA